MTNNLKVAKKPRNSLFRRAVKWASIGCLGSLFLLVTLIVCLFLLLQTAVPKSYTLVENPIPPPSPASTLGGNLDGFESPYIGHTGSWDGIGGAMFGASKTPDLDIEVSMGLRWTFMCVFWSKMEPHGPIDLSAGIPPEWRSLDQFVIEAHQLKLNILLQAPVVGGNAGGPPSWAGRRVKGKSAPADMDALIQFTGKLAKRYCPGGTLAMEQGWGSEYGIRAWELDNEPESYFTNWKGQAADYAEFVTRSAEVIKQIDPLALILAPSVASGSHGADWLKHALNPDTDHASPTFIQNKKKYSVGPSTDVVTFHNYEGLDSFFSGQDFTITDAFMQIRKVFESMENASANFSYPRKMEYWHTEGNFDFIGALSEERRVNWRFQFFTRAFAAGIRKVVVMDAKTLEQQAVRTYIQALPNPFPMLPATSDLNMVNGNAIAYKHPEGDTGFTWIIWAQVDTGDATIQIPVSGTQVEVIEVTGTKSTLESTDGWIQINLNGDSIMPEPIIIFERP